MGGARLWWKDGRGSSESNFAPGDVNRISSVRPPLPPTHVPFYDTLDDVPSASREAADDNNGELDGLDLGASWDALMRVRGSVQAAHRYANTSESLFSIPDLLDLHKSLEVEPVAPAGVPDVTQPSTATVGTAVSPPPPATEPEETLEQMIESLDVTMMRLNWRCELWCKLLSFDNLSVVCRAAGLNAVGWEACVAVPLHSYPVMKCNQKTNVISLLSLLQWQGL